jgi:hypothetical protein
VVDLISCEPLACQDALRHGRWKMFFAEQSVADMLQLALYAKAYL